MPDNTMAEAERWAADIGGPAYAIDDQTAIRVVDGTVEVVSEGQWRHFRLARAYASGHRPRDVGGSETVEVRPGGARGVVVGHHVGAGLAGGRARRISSSWARAAICWANSAVWMPWKSALEPADELGLGDAQLGVGRASRPR